MNPTSTIYTQNRYTKITAIISIFSRFSGHIDIFNKMSMKGDSDTLQIQVIIKHKYNAEIVQKTQIYVFSNSNSNQVYCHTVAHNEHK